jgi:hypothetical protein
MSETIQEEPSNSQKFFPIIIFIGLIAFGFLFYSYNQQTDLKKDFSDLFGAVGEIRQANPFQLSTANNTITESYEFTAEEAGETPFSLLTENTEVKSDQYDFGVFVKAINQQASNSDYYWALYVNEEYAQKAADQIDLNVGDKVEWRWEQVQTAPIE